MAPRWRGLGFHPALKLLQDANQARAQLECELVQETQELAWKYNNKWIKQARKHKRQWAWMIEQTDASFQEVFSQVSSADSIKLLPWCISAAVPLSYRSGMVATATQQDEDISAASEPHGSLAPCPSSSPVHPPGTPPLPVPPLLDIPLVGTPPVGHPFAEFLAISTQKKQDCSPSSLLNHHHNKRTHVASQEIKIRSEHSSAQGNKDMPERIPGTGISFEQQQQESVSSPSSPTRDTANLEDGTVAGSPKSTRDQASLDSELSRENVDDSDMDTATRDCISCSRQRWGVHTNCLQEVPDEGMGFCRLSKGSLWMEAQLKRISKNCQDMWGHNHECVRAE